MRRPSGRGADGSVEGRRRLGLLASSRLGFAAPPARIASRNHVEKPSKGTVDRAGVWERLRHIWVEDHDVGALSDARDVLAPHAASEVILLTHFIDSIVTACLLHSLSVPAVSRVER